MKIPICISWGTNEELKKTLRDRYADTERVHVLDFTTEAHLYMAAADILFTKPGGLTSTEAVAAKVALVHTKPIPDVRIVMLLFHTTWDVCIRRYGRCRDTKGTKA